MRTVIDLGLPANIRRTDKPNLRLRTYVNPSIGSWRIPVAKSQIQSQKHRRCRVNGPPENANARLQPGARVNKPDYSQTLRASKRDVNESYGQPELCGWQVYPNVFWIQTTDPQFGRKLEKRNDTRRVEVTGVDHFRRTFELRGSRRKIRRIIDRYLVSAGDQFFGDLRPQKTSKQSGKVNIAGPQIAAAKGGWAALQPLTKAAMSTLLRASLATSNSFVPQKQRKYSVIRLLSHYWR